MRSMAWWSRWTGSPTNSGSAPPRNARDGPLPSNSRRFRNGPVSLTSGSRWGEPARSPPSPIWSRSMSGGVTVSRASLHNEDEVKKKDVRIGDQVFVQRAGDVIPEVVKVIKSVRDGSERPFEMPGACPVCGARAVRDEEAITRCINVACPAQLKANIKHLASKAAFDIDGLGDKLIDQLVEKNYVRSYADIFGLSWGGLRQLERMGDKSAENLVNAIAASKEVPFSRFF